MNYRLEKKEATEKIKAERGCVRCGEKDPDCLDFHHLDPATKTYTISRLYGGTWSWERILKEIELCEVLCANCHRKQHGKERRLKRFMAELANEVREESA